MPDRLLHILFVLLHPGFVRHYETTLAALAEQGHRITLGFESARNKIGEQAQLTRLIEGYPSIRIVPLPEATSNRWHCLAVVVRLLQDYALYYDPRFEAATALRARAAEQLPRSLAGLCEAVCRSAASRRVFNSLLRACERVIPTNPAIDACLRELAPDVLLITPLVDWGSDQVHYLKSAAVMGVPSALCVASWDNLTNKGAIRFSPTRVIVWNDAQRREAVDLHRVPSDRVVMTGAQTFDHWFGRQPSRSREEFCAAVGLDPSQVILVYLGSSFFIAPDEAQFFDRFLRAMRQSRDPRIRDANIIVRPHPLNIQQWLAFDFTGVGRVAVFPTRVGVEVFTEQFRADFFDSLHHASVVVGVNTSAMIEAGIAGRPVFTVLAPEFTHSQAGTIHFQYLTSEAGGVARTASGIDEALEGIAHALSHPEEYAAQARRYITAFVRPNGWDIPAASHLQLAIEGLAEPVPAVRARGLLVALGRALLAVPSVAAYFLLLPPEKSRRKGSLGPVDGALVRGGFVILLHLLSAVVWLRSGVRALLKLGDRAYRHGRKGANRSWQSFERGGARRARDVGRAESALIRPRRVLQKPTRRLRRLADDQMKRGRRWANLTSRAVQRGGRRVRRGGRRVVNGVRQILRIVRNARPWRGVAR